MYSNKLGAEDDFELWPAELYDSGPAYQSVPDYNPNVFSSAPSIWTSPAPTMPEKPWYSGIVDILGPLSTAAGNIYRTMQQPGAQVPPGYARTATGQLVPQGGMTSQSWFVPALLIGGGALFLLTRKRR